MSMDFDLDTLIKIKKFPKNVAASTVDTFLQLYSNGFGLMKLYKQCFTQYDFGLYERTERNVFKTFN